MQHLAWVDVQLFLALSRTHSLRAAGDALGFDVSTVSRKLSALERRVGSQLFDRSRAGIAATPLARDLLPAAEEMERAAHDFERHIEGFEKHIAGAVRVSVPPSVGDLFAGDLVAGLAGTHPGLDLILEVSTALVDIQQRRADLAVRLVRPTSGELTSVRLARLPHSPFARADLAQQLAPVASWADLPWIRPESGTVAREVAKLSARRTVLITDSIPAQLDAARSGLGVAVLPTFFGPRYGLVPVSVARSVSPPHWPQPDLWLVRHAAQRRVPRISAMAGWLTDRITRIVGGEIERDDDGHGAPR